MENLNFKELFCLLLPAVIIALVGGIIKSLSEAIEGRWCGWKIFIARAAVSGFAGMMIYLLLEWLWPTLPPSGWAFFCGMSGFGGSEILNRMAKFTDEKIDAILGDEDKNGDGHDLN